MPSSSEHIIPLLRYSIGCSKELPVLSSLDWDYVLAVAKEQSVLALLSRAVSDSDHHPPLKIRSQVNFAAELMTEKNRKLTGYAREITETFAGMGFGSCVLKGPGTARLYPNPSLRHGGDIDLWVPGERKAVLKAVEGRWKRGSLCYHHTAIRPFGDKTEVEVHFTPSWMNNPFRNRYLQKYFSENAEVQCSRMVPGLGFAVPNAEFNLVYNAVHIYRHLLFEGVGMRQIIDYYFILKNSSAEERSKALIVLDSLGMTSFAGALMYVERELFLLSEEYFLCAPDSRFGKFFLEEIFLSGNFGQYDTRYHYGSNIFVRAFQRMQRLLHFVRYAPSEVLWAPYFKIWQRIRYIRN